MLSVSPFLLREQKNLSHNRYAIKKTDEGAPRTKYFNLYGDYVPDTADNKYDKILVLTLSNEPDKIDSAIKTGNIILVPTQEILDKMIEAYKATEADHLEQYIAVGKEGKSSAIIPGSSGEVNAEQTKQARRDLIKKGDVFLYSIHSHPNPIGADGNIMKVGLPTPSDTDMVNNRKGTPDVILGYKQKTIFPNPNRIDNDTQPIEVTQRIGFFNSSKSIIDIDFKDFIDAVKKINKKY